MEMQLIIITLFFSAFFSGIEIAFVSSNKLKIELQKRRGTFTGSILSGFVKKPSHFIGATLIGNNIALVILGVQMSKLLEPLLHSHLPEILQSDLGNLFIQTIIITTIVLIVGEFIPKVLFRINPNKILTFFSVPLLVIQYLLYPLVFAIIHIARFILRSAFKLKMKESGPVFSKLDLEYFVKESTPAEEQQPIDTELFENALYLIKVKVRECMVPRPEIQAIDINTPVERLKEVFEETGLSRVIVYKETIDNILGYIHHFSLLQDDNDINKHLITIPLVPETMTAKDLLSLFINERKNIAWVVDEFGGTAGIVTLEDVLEEIFGEIKDEHDVEQFIEKQIADNEFIFSGRLEIDYLNETHNLNIPEGEYETLAGYIVAHFKSIPKRNERIKIDHFEFLILSVSDTRIETVKLKVKEGEEEND